MTNEQLAEIKKRRDLSEPGPWVTGGNALNRKHILVAGTHDTVAVVYLDAIEKVFAYPHEALASTAEFIAHAPQDIDALLAEVERLRRHLGEIP